MNTPRRHTAGSGEDPTQTAREALYSMYTAAGGWGGSSGIFSSAVQYDPSRMIGYFLNLSAPTPLDQFQGVQLGLYSLVIAPTIAADVNMDGAVDAADIGITFGGYDANGSGMQWTQGDVNYDGVIDAADVGIVSGAYGNTTPVESPGVEVTASSVSDLTATLSLASTTTNVAKWFVYWMDDSRTEYSAATAATTGQADLTDVAASHTYAAPGEYKALVVARSGGLDQIAGTITVNVAVPTTVTATGPAEPVAEGQPYTLTLHGPEGITMYTTDWGDGSAPQNIAGPDAVVTHVYTTAPASKTIYAKATDDTNTYDAAPVTVLLTPAAPADVTGYTLPDDQIGLDWTDASAIETGYELQLSPDPSFQSSVTTVSLAANTTSATNDWTFNSSTDICYYRLRSLGANGDSDWQTGQITNVTAALDDNPVAEGQTATVTLTGTPNITLWTVSWGDGSESEETALPNDTLTHVYSHGTYTLRAVASDGTLDFAAQPIAVTITNVSPVLDSFDDQTIHLGDTRFLLTPGLPGTGLLCDAPESATNVLQLINAFPRDIAGLKPSREQLEKLTKAFNEFGAGAAVLVDKAKLVVTIAEDAQQVLQWTSAIGLTIASGGGAVVAYRAGASSMQILKAAVPFIVATVQTGAVAVDQNAETIAKKLNMSPENATYIRWGARGVQLICLLYAWRTARMARTAGAGSNCFVAGTDVATSDGSTAIEYLHPAEKVVPDAVQGTVGAPPASVGGATAVNPATWRSVSLRSPDPNHPGEYYLMDLLEPLSWIAENHATVGAWADISIPEMQVSGMAQVTDIEACPPIEAGQGQVILGTFSHISNDVYDLKFAGEDQAIGVTSAHPIWSLDRAGWIGAAALLPGEHVATETGSAVVDYVVPEPGEHWVYNIEVEGDHRYLVGELHVLVHNAGASFGQRVLRPYGKVTSPQNVGEELMNRAVEERLANPVLNGDNNLSVVRYRQGGQVETEVFSNVRSGGDHSEKVAWEALQQKGVGVDDIIAWYSERSPCGNKCLPLFQSIKLSAEKVFWSADYTLRENRAWFGKLINDVIAHLQN